MSPRTAPVSVVVPALNRQGHIAAAVRSALAQQPQPGEVIVVDDGSTDGTADVAADAGARVLTNTEQRGSGGARNCGILQAREPLVALLDSDDEWLPGHLRSLLAFPEHVGLRTSGARGSVTGRAMGVVSGRRRQLQHGDLFWPGPQFVTSGALFPTHLAREAGLFRPLRRAQDLDLWIRLLSRAPAWATGRPTVCYGEHEDQTTVDLGPTREQVQALLREYEDCDWVTPHLLRRVRNLLVWDQLADRPALERLRSYLSDATSPAALVDLLQVYAYRRMQQARSRAIDAGRRPLQVRD